VVIQTKKVPAGSVVRRGVPDGAPPNQRTICIEGSVMISSAGKSAPRSNCRLVGAESSSRQPRADRSMNPSYRQSVGPSVPERVCPGLIAVVTEAAEQVAGSTRISMLPVTPPAAAEIVLIPPARPDTIPPGVTVATALSELDQVT
jgi:hypothetical protein